MKFLCGCNLPSTDSLRGDPELKTLALCTYDTEGFIVCVVHHQRRYGWRSLPLVAHRVMDGVEEEIIHRPDFGMARGTELEIERFMLFDEMPAARPFMQGMAKRYLDRRDNRDPEEIGIGVMESGSLGEFAWAHTNGIPRRPERTAQEHHEIAVRSRALLEYQRQLATSQQSFFT